MDTTKVLLICLLLLPTIAFAHGGRTNAAGCHNDNKRGGYHCHNGGTTSQRQSVRAPNNSASMNSVKPQALTAQPTSTKTTATSVDATSNLVLKIQYALNQLGYAVGKPDGISGKKTINGIKDFQAENEMVIDGKPSELLLDALLKKVRM
jgi:hypothetical protein